MSLRATNPWPTASYSYRQYGTSANFINARVFVPLSYDANTTDKHPVVIFCHGDGEKQSGAVFGQPTTANSSQMTDNGQYAFVTTANQAQFPCVFILIQRVGPSDLTQAIKNMVDTLSTEFHSTGGQSKIDLDRVIITGLSGGGGTTMSYMCSYSSALAAAVVLSPATPPGYSASNVGATLPVWFFHSDNDGTEQPPNSIDAVNNLRNIGSHPIFTYYDTGAHTSTTWTAAYNTPALIPWLAAQRRGQPSTSDPARITITTPSTNMNYVTTAGNVTVAGTCTQISTYSPVISMVQYSHGSFGDAKISDYPNAQTASGTVDNWTFLDSLPVNQWNTNPFQYSVVAIGTSWSAATTSGGLGGRTYYGSVINLIKPDSTDTVSPAITVSSPTSTSTFSTTVSSLTVSGTASDNVGVASITWANSRGGSGTASNTLTGSAATWAVSGITLQSGVNVLTFTATDNSSHTASATLTVTSSSAQSVTTWQSTVFTTLELSVSTISGLTADPDGDGIPNLLEYAFGGNPMRVSAPGTVLPVITAVTGHLQAVFTRVAPTDISYIVETSSDCASWTAVATLSSGATNWTGTATVNETGSGATRSVTVTDPFTLGSGKHFLRVRVTYP